VVGLRNQTRAVRKGFHAENRIAVDPQLHVIIAYDIGVERLHKVYLVMKQYLNWIQNSAFEGDLSLGQLEELRVKVMKVIDEDQDSIVVFLVSNPEWIDRKVWGRERGLTESII
jgi:CRISPR-associated protein Cas2